MRNDVHIGIDIGGTLAKIAVVAPRISVSHIILKFSAAVMVHEKFHAEEHDIIPAELGFISSDPRIELEFAMFSFTSRNLTPLLDFLSELLRPPEILPGVVKLTGGGAVKFRSALEDSFPNIIFAKVDEIEAISIGFSFLVQRANSAFIFKSVADPRQTVPLTEIVDPFPLLLVNIGSGVSMIKIDGPGIYQRVQGSPIGGGTVLGLGKVLFGATSFEEIMELSMHGDSSSVDLSVGELIGAPPDDEFWNYNTLASSLTKLSNSGSNKASRADLAQSIVRMVSYNIGNIAFLAASLHQCSRIYFSGKYVNKHIPTMEAISYAVKFYENWKPPPTVGAHLKHSVDLQPSWKDCWRDKKCEVRFLYHEGYVGAIGALISS